MGGENNDRYLALNTFGNVAGVPEETGARVVFVQRGFYDKRRELFTQASPLRFVT